MQVEAAALPSNAQAGAVEHDVVAAQEEGERVVEREERRQVVQEGAAEAAQRKEPDQVQEGAEEAAHHEVELEGLAEELVAVGARCASRPSWAARVEE